MFPIRIILAGLGLFAAISSIHQAHGQSLPGSLSFTVSGSFTNPVAESSNSLFVRDNNLTNGYNSGADLTNAPSGYSSRGVIGSALFQWGRAATNDAYPHPSALWFVPVNVSNAVPEKEFEIGYLYYRNGAIQSDIGASAIDLNLTFTVPSGTIVTSFTSNLINTPNTGTAAENADIVSLSNRFAPLTYKDNHGNLYYLEIVFRLDADTLSNSTSNTTEFRAYEGAVSRAELIARFTTTPVAYTIPEPSALVLGVLGSLPLFRRRRA